VNRRLDSIGRKNEVSTQDLLLLIVSDYFGEDTAAKLEENWDYYFGSIEGILGTKLSDDHLNKMVKHRGSGPQLSKENRELVAKLLCGIPVEQLVEIESERRGSNQQQHNLKVRKQALTSVERAWYIVENPSRFPKLLAIKVIGKSFCKLFGKKFEPIPSTLGRIRSRKSKALTRNEIEIAALGVQAFHENRHRWPDVKEVKHIVQVRFGKLPIINSVADIMQKAREGELSSYN
jgi:hypothetical protein